MFISKNCQLWKDSIIIKILGKKVSFYGMKERLQRLWKPTRIMEVMDINYAYFMVKFDNPVDREKALSGGPWILYDHYVVVRQ